MGWWRVETRGRGRERREREREREREIKERGNKRESFCVFFYISNARKVLFSVIWRESDESARGKAAAFFSFPLVGAFSFLGIFFFFTSPPLGRAKERERGRAGIKQQRFFSLD